MRCAPIVRGSLSSRAAALELLDGAGDDLDATLAFELGARGLLVGEMVQLALNLEVALDAARIEAAILDGLAHGAAGIVLMAAIGEAALRLQLLDVREALRRALVSIPELDLAHARRVEQQAALGQQDEVAVRRGMTALR